MKMKTLILTDNPSTLEIALEIQRRYENVDIRQSPGGCLIDVLSLNVTTEHLAISSTYSLVISLHCKQIFPKELVLKTRCINIHPGYNPYNRGWFPHVFSFINNQPTGVTIHEIDGQLDHGRIIVQKKYKLKSWDTSASAYNEIMRMERELLLDWFERIRDGLYDSFEPFTEGNINYKKDYERLKHIDLDTIGTFGEFLNLLRALSHSSFRNAYIIDSEGNRVYVRVVLEKDEISTD
jgi:methionyl-tRNA formyltransferase